MTFVGIKISVKSLSGTSGFALVVHVETIFTKDRLFARFFFTKFIGGSSALRIDGIMSEFGFEKGWLGFSESSTLHPHSS